MRMKIRIKHLTIRVPLDLYEDYIKKAQNKGKKEHRLVRLSEVIREAMEANR
jgi:hypothetical protein